MSKRTLDRKISLLHPRQWILMWPALAHCI